MAEARAGALNNDDHCFACGRKNPGGLGMRVEYAPAEAICRVTLADTFQGWAGIAHGGVVATLLDEIMAHAVLHFVGHGVTASLELRYLQPVPLGRELLVRGEVVEKGGRLVKARGSVALTEDGSPLARGEARFVLRPALALEEGN